MKSHRSEILGEPGGIDQSLEFLEVGQPDFDGYNKLIGMLEKPRGRLSEESEGGAGSGL